jgi:hypothetical protein
MIAPPPSISERALKRARLCIQGKGSHFEHLLSTHCKTLISAVSRIMSCTDWHVCWCPPVLTRAHFKVSKLCNSCQSDQCRIDILYSVWRHGSNPEITTYTHRTPCIWCTLIRWTLGPPNFWSTSADFSLAEGLNNVQFSDQTMQSNRTLKPVHSPNHAVQLNPQPNALNKSRSRLWRHSHTNHTPFHSLSLN